MSSVDYSILNNQKTVLYCIYVCLVSRSDITAVINGQSKVFGLSIEKLRNICLSDDVIIKK